MQRLGGGGGFETSGNFDEPLKGLESAALVRCKKKECSGRWGESKQAKILMDP